MICYLFIFQITGDLFLHDTRDDIHMIEAIERWIGFRDPDYQITDPNTRTVHKNEVCFFKIIFY